MYQCFHVNTALQNHSIDFYSLVVAYNRVYYHTRWCTNELFLHAIYRSYNVLHVKSV